MLINLEHYVLHLTIRVGKEKERERERVDHFTNSPHPLSSKYLSKYTEQRSFNLFLKG